MSNQSNQISSRSAAYNLHELSPIPPVAYGLPRTPEKWEVFFIGDKWGESDLGWKEIPVFAWNASGKLFAFWTEHLHNSLRGAYSLNNGETWTHIKNTYFMAPQGSPPGSTYDTFWVDSIVQGARGSIAFVLPDGQVVVFAHSQAYYDQDGAGYVVSPDPGEIQRFLWNGTDSGGQFGSGWTLDIPYTASSSKTVLVTGGQSADGASRGVLWRESQGASPIELKFATVADDGTLGTAETVRTVVSPLSISGQMLRFVGQNARALWHEGTKYYRSDRISGVWQTPVEFSLDAADVDSVLIDPLATLGTPWLDPPVIDENGNFFLLDGVTGNEAYPTDFTFQYRRRSGAVSTVNFRDLETSPSEDPNLLMQSWPGPSAGADQIFYVMDRRALWVKDNRYAFFLLLVSTSDGENASQTRAGERCEYCIPAKYSQQAEWLLRLDLGIPNQGFVIR